MFIGQLLFSIYVALWHLDQWPVAVFACRVMLSKFAQLLASVFLLPCHFIATGSVVSVCFRAMSCHQVLFRCHVSSGFLVTACDYDHNCPVSMVKQCGTVCLAVSSDLV